MNLEIPCWSYYLRTYSLVVTKVSPGLIFLYRVIKKNFPQKYWRVLQKKTLYLLYGWINPIPRRKKCSSFQWKIKLKQFPSIDIPDCLNLLVYTKIERKRLFAGTLFQIWMFPVYWNSYLLRRVFDNSCWVNYLWIWVVRNLRE